MSNGNNKKNVGLGRVLFGFIVSLLSFGAFAYLYMMSRGMNPVDDTIVQLSKISVLVGIFFLILTLGFALPAYIAGRKNKD